MKRLMIFVVGLVFVFSTVAFAADKPAAAAKAKEPVAAAEKAPAAKAEKTPAAPEAAVTGKAAPVKVAKMKATGTVTEVSDVMLKIERTVKGKAEAMEFALEKPVAKIKAGDKVMVNYVEKDGKNVATKVAKVAAKKKTVKKAEPAAPAEPAKK